MEYQKLRGKIRKTRDVAIQPGHAPMLLPRFLKDRRGGVAPMFALTLVPIVGFIGAAIDYSRANSIRTSMQAAADATSLAMSKLAPTLTQSQLQTQATAYFNALMNNS